MTRHWAQRVRLVVLASTLALAVGCTAQSTDHGPTTTAPSTTTVSQTPTSTTSVVPTSSVIPTTTAESAAVSTETVHDTAPVVAEPYVVECLDGTPGPALWSDGTMRFSQWCFDTTGGAQYLESERRANAFTCNGVICQNPYTGGSYPDPNRRIPQPGTVKPATPEEAALNKQLAEQSGCKTSGCTQTFFGCRDGYITGDVCRRWGY